jgi:putative ABC transport system substrate-binding protein
MNRRELIKLVGGAVAWPLTARAQQGDRMRRIGVLMNLNAGDQEGQSRIAGLLQGLQEQGWAVGGNVRIDYRWGGNDAALYRKGAEELIALAPDVVLASGTQSLGAMHSLTRTVPIVFRERRRSRRWWLRCQPRPARRHFDGVHGFRVFDRRKVARAAETNRT